jgi:hypothetical protein
VARQERHGAAHRITHRRYGYGFGGGWMYGYGDRDGDGIRDDLTMTSNLGEQFDGFGDGGDGGGDGGGE